MRRRELLRDVSVLAVGSVGLAGCGAPDPDQEGTPTEGGTPTQAAGTPTEAGETPTGSPTGTPTGTPQTETTAGGGEENQVAMVTEGENYIFDPIGLFVEPGTTITWVIESGTHSSTAYAEENDAAERIPEDADAWDSGVLTDEGATFEATFDVTGTYDYYCTPHKTLGMIGRLVVGEPGGPAEGSQPPDGEVPESSAIVEQGAIGWDEFSG